ncbi:MAG: cellulase family glycosylhydrolase [Chloroflexi bacterium]|nr:cellulase family glycosylhydrolase [Chloroflexota bacterium]
MKQSTAFNLQTIFSFLQQPATVQLVQWIVLPLLIALGLMFPPISLAERVLEAGYTAVPLSGGTILDPDGTQLTILPEGMSGEVKVRFTSIPRADFLESGAGYGSAQDNLLTAHPDLELKSPLYSFSLRGPMPVDLVLSIPIPNDAEPWETLDLYGWTGQEWVWLPHSLLGEEVRIESHLQFLPQLVGVMQTKQVSPLISAEFQPGETMPEGAEVLSTLEASGLFLQNDGFNGQTTIGGIPSLTPQEGYLILPVLENVYEGVVRDDLTHNILTSPDLRANHIAEIVSLVQSEGYPGIIIDYQGVTPDLADDFLAFLRDLSAALEEQSKLLGVRVGETFQVSPDKWNTGGYDWQGIGQIVDLFQVPAVDDPAAFVPGGQMDSLLDFATSLINRSKLQLVLSSYSQDVSGQSINNLTYAQALSLWGSLFEVSTPEEASPGEEVSIEVTSAPPLQFWAEPQIYWFTFSDAQGEHKVYLENGQSLSHKLDLAASRHLTGVSLQGLFAEGSDSNLWLALQNYQAAAPSNLQSQFVLLWEVQTADGKSITSPQVLSQSGSWEPATPGEYSIALSVSDNGGQSPLVASGSIPLNIGIPTPTRTPSPTPTPGTTQPAPTPTPTPQPVISAPVPTGTGFDYGIQVHPFQGAWGPALSAAQDLGMRWVKFQVRWSWIEQNPGIRNWNAAGLEEAVNAFSAAGIKILFSVVAAPPWSRSVHEEDGPPDDFNQYAAFVADLSSVFKGRVQAIEVMNETNLKREWNTGRPLSAAEYVDLLCRTYNAVKAVDSSMIIVSGAPTPTGWNDGIIAIDDLAYLEQMYQAGLKNCSDAVGVHPSGYNNPPWANAASYSDPTATFGAKGHRSWFFLDTIQSYHNVMAKYGDGNTKLWATEWGWAVSQGIGAPNPGYEFAADNTEQEQADFIVEGYKIARNSGFMGVMFLWNLNFEAVNPGSEQGKFGIVYSNYAPRPAYTALRDARQNGTLP